VFATSAPAQDKAPAADSGGNRIDEVLTQLEKRSDGLESIRCDVRFVEEDRINLSRQTKDGRILFWMTNPNPHFLIHFHKTEAEGVPGKQEWYLFDGRWLYQGLERIKQVTKQEIARPDEKIDLFDLETAPFPVPFGQRKDKILRNFHVTLAAPAAGDPPNTDHLVCVPQAASPMRRKYDKLELFVLKDLHLPSRIVVTKSDGLEVNTADFPDLSAKSINVGLTQTAFAKPEVWDKQNYTEVVETLVPPDRPP